MRTTQSTKEVHLCINQCKNYQFLVKGETPALPGYLSVWSCDGHMTDIITSRVKRPLTYSLTDLRDKWKPTIETN